MVAEHEEPQPAPRSRPIVWIVGFVAVVALVILVLPAIQAARTAARRMESSNNLKQIWLGMQNYHDVLNSLPSGGTFREDGTGMYGWPTLILPYLESNNFGEHLDRSLPWDDLTHVDAYIQFPFRTYRDPGIVLQQTPDGLRMIHYAANEWIFHRNSAVRLDEIAGGEHTLMVADAFGEFMPVGSPFNWRDPTVAFRTSSRQFGNVTRKDTLVVFVDGGVRSMDSSVDTEIFGQLAGPKSLRPSAAMVERPTEPYRLKDKDYRRFLIVNEHGKHLRKGGYFVKARLSANGRELELKFDDRFEKSNDELLAWRNLLKPYLESAALEVIYVTGSLHAKELEPFLESPTVKRLNLRHAMLSGGEDAISDKFHKIVVLD